MCAVKTLFMFKMEQLTDDEILVSRGILSSSMEISAL